MLTKFVDDGCADPAEAAAAAIEEEMERVRALTALAAARALGLEVVMVVRPYLPKAAEVANAAAALDWLVHQAASTLRGV